MQALAQIHLKEIIMRFAKTALYILLVCQILDGLLTYIGVSRGIDEGSPIGLILFGAYGVLMGLALLKSFSILLTVLVLMQHPKHFGWVFRVAAFGCVLLYSGTILGWMVVLILDLL